MTTYIEIDNGIARLVEHTVHQEVPLDLLDQYLSTPAPITTPLMPMGFVAGHFDTEANLFIMLVERPPRIEHVRIELINNYDDTDRYYDCDCELSLEETDRWNDTDWREHNDYNHRRDQADFSDLHTGYASADDLPNTIDLPVPWEYYEFSGRITPDTIAATEHYNISGGRLFWSPTRLTKPRQQLYIPTLPNLSEGRICWGEQSSTNDSLAAKINDMVNNFYHYSFNEDYGHFNWPAPLHSLATKNIDIDGLGIPAYHWDTMPATTWEPYTRNGSQSVPEATGRYLPPLPATIEDMKNWYFTLGRTARLHLSQAITEINTPVSPDITA